MSLDFTTVKVIAASLATTVKVVNPVQRVAVSQPNAPVVVAVRAPGGFRGATGAQGDPGPAGEDGEQGVDGAFINTFRGEWDSEVQYPYGDIVQESGSTYVWRGVDPSPLGSFPYGPTEWDLVAEAGAQGDTGQIVNSYAGPWEPGEYAFGDMVTWTDGSTYINGDKLGGGAPTTEEPPNSPWELFVAAGEPGAPGDPGDPGAPGDPGLDGADGLSAYELALLGGFVGTEAEWLLSLKGDPGDPGDPGAPGAPGDPGADGADGASAYEVAVANGFVGTEAAWILSLKGDPGDPGADGADGTLITVGTTAPPSPFVGQLWLDTN